MTIQNNIENLARQYNRGLMTHAEFVERVNEELEKFPAIDKPSFKVTVVHISEGCAALMSDAEMVTLNRTENLSDFIRVQRDTALEFGAEKVIVIITPYLNTDYSFSYCGAPDGLRL